MSDPQATREPEYVVLLHGLGRTNLSMKLPEMRLAAKGYRTVNPTYPSRRHSIPHLAAFVRDVLDERIASDTVPVHFLTHSMGGILLRYLMTTAPLPNLARVVMLCPPNQGSQLAHRLRDNPIFRATMGPAGQQLSQSGESIPLRLGPVDFDLGVITGNRNLTTPASLLPAESDGKVAVEEAKVEGMKDFLVLPRGHTFIMNDAEVVVQAVHFFRHGHFRHDGGED